MARFRWMIAACFLPLLALFAADTDPTSQESAALDRWLGENKTVLTIEGLRGFILHPTRPAPDGTKPWVWYAPTLTSRHPAKENQWLIGRLRDRGIAVCGVDVGESYGSPEGVALYSRFYDELVTKHGLDKKPALLPQSRGGLMLYNWASDNPDKVRCIGGIFPVGDIRAWPGLDAAAKAYQIPRGKLEMELHRYNPLHRLEPLAKARIPILHVHGDSDTLIPIEVHSRAIQKRYAELGGKMEIVVVPGKGHEVAAELFESEALLRFLSDHKKSPDAEAPGP